MFKFKFVNLFIVVMLLLVVNSCGLFRSPLPENARLQISSSDLEETELIISLNFLAERVAQHEEGIIVGSETVILPLSIDTMTVTLPFDEEFDISRHRRFYAEVRFPEGMENIDLEMRGLIDGDEKFRATSEMQSEGSLRFVYYFRSGEGIVVRPQP